MGLDIRQSKQGVVLAVVAKPGAKKDDIVGLYGTSLKVAVTAAPEKGKANKAIAKLLAKRLGVAPSNVSIVGGETSKQKRILVQGVPAGEVASRLGV